MNEELRNYIKDSNLLSLNSFDDGLELNLTELYFYLQLPITSLDDSLDFWDKRSGNNNKEGIVELNWNKWESFDFIDSDNLNFIKKVRKDLKEFEKEQYESLVDQDEWKFPIYLKDEFILPRNIQSAFSLPTEQKASSNITTKDWKGTIETILSDDKLQQEFEDDPSMLKMFDLPEIDIALELNLAIPKETIIQIKELMIQNKSISKLDYISALLLPYDEHDSDRFDCSTYVLPESPRSGSPPIFPRRQSDFSPISTLSHTNPIEIIQDLFDDNSKSQNQTLEPLLLTSPSGKEINMVDWNELEFIKPFPITSSPAHSTNAVKSNVTEMIWSSQPLEIHSSPPTDVGIEVPIFPRTTISIKIKEEPIDEFESQMRILLVDEELSEDEDEIDELEEDDHIPGSVDSDELNTLLEAVIVPAESSPNVEILAGDILIDSRLKIPTLSSNSSMIPESESIFHFTPTSQLLFPYAPISNRSLSIDLSWQPFTMGLNDIKTVWEVVDDIDDEEKEMMRSCEDLESFREKLEIVEEEEECLIVYSVSSIPAEFEVVEEESILPRVSEPISIAFVSTTTTVEEEVQQISNILTSPSISTRQLREDSLIVSAPVLSQASSPPLPTSSFVDIISTQRLIPEVGKILLECRVPTKRTVDDSVILEDGVGDLVVGKMDMEKKKPTSIMEIIEILSSSESEEEEDDDIQIIEQPNSINPTVEVITPSADELVTQNLIVPTSLEYIRKETNDNNTSKTWSSGDALAQFLVSKGKQSLTQPKPSNNRPQVALISKSTWTILKLPPFSVTSTQRPLHLPFPIPSYLTTTATIELPLESYRIIALPEILQMRSHYSSLLTSGITLIDRSSQFHTTPHVIQEPHLILDSNTCVVFFQLIKLVGNVYRKEEIDLLLLAADGGREEEGIYWRGLKRDEAVFTSIHRLSRSYEKVVCIFEEFTSTSNSTSTTKSKGRDFAYTKPVLDALDLLARTIQDQFSSKHGVDVVIVKDPEESTQVVKKCLTTLLLVEDKDGEVEVGRLWLTDDPTVNEIRSLQVLEQLNPFSACYNLAKYGDSMVDFISLDDDSRRLVFEKVNANGRSVSIADLITTMNTIRQDVNNQRRFDSTEEVQGRSFDEMETEYEGQELKGTQEGESLSFSEVFDYNTYDYDG